MSSLPLQQLTSPPDSPAEGQVYYDSAYQSLMRFTDGGWVIYISSAPTGYIPNSEKGVANGVATLDGSAKVPVSQLPNTVMEYQGAWNAATNTPILSDGTGTNGAVYRVSVAGTQNLGSGPITFQVGDFAVYSGSLGQWQDSPAADGVTSVNGMQGAVTLTTSNIPEGTHEYFTDARAQAAAVQNAINSGNTIQAPSEDAVYQALAGKLSLSGGTLTGTLIGPTITASSALNSSGTLGITGLATFGANLLLSAGSFIQDGISAPAVSGAGQGQIYFDSSSNEFMVSQNGGSYVPLATGGTVTAVTATTPLSVTNPNTTPNITIPQASASASGFLALGDWSTFNSKQAALSFNSPLLNNTNIISITQSGVSTDGYLSSTDWNTFNSKQAALSFGNLTPGSGLAVTGGTGAVIGSGAAVSIASGYYLPTTSDQSNWNSKQAALTFTAPLINTLNTITITQSGASTNGYLSSTDWNTFNSKQAAGSYLTAITGDVVASGPGSAIATIQANVVSNSKLAQMAATTIKGNNTGVIANALDLTAAQVAAMVGPSITTLGTITSGVWNGTVTAGSQFITSGTTFTTPSNITTNTLFTFTLIGGGGGGGGINSASAKGSGGGGGAVCVLYISGLSPSTAYNIIIGLGGAGGIDTTTPAAAGGSTTLVIGLTTYTATGGGAGASTTDSAGGIGGTSTNGSINMSGHDGWASGAATANAPWGAGGDSARGWGQGGAPVSANGAGTAGNPGKNYGAGGSGSNGVGSTGGAGSQGAILVEWKS